MKLGYKSVYMDAKVAHLVVHINILVGAKMNTMISNLTIGLGLAMNHSCQPKVWGPGMTHQLSKATKVKLKLVGRDSLDLMVHRHSFIHLHLKENRWVICSKNLLLLPVWSFLVATMDPLMQEEVKEESVIEMASAY